MNPKNTNTFIKTLILKSMKFLFLLAFVLVTAAFIYIYGVLYSFFFFIQTIEKIIMNISENMKDIFTLNTIWLNLGITEFSFLAFLRLLFLITIFCLFFLHIGLVYTEYLNIKYTPENLHLKAGTELGPKIQRIAKYFGGSHRNLR